MEIITTIGLFIFIAGFIIGLGAVTVIDFHGLLARKSGYWTEATTRTHKITKPLIWTGILLAIIGGILFYYNTGFNFYAKIHAILAVVLILNGLFLSFRVSPYLIEREHAGVSAEILPKTWQDKIFVSFIFSFVGWWGAVVVLVCGVANLIK